MAESLPTTDTGVTPPTSNHYHSGTNTAVNEHESRIDALELGGAGGGIPATLVDAKGDIIVATAADVVARLAVGAEGTSPVSRAAAGTGIAWETVSGGGGAALASTAPPALADPAAVGTGTTASRADHVHPRTGLILTGDARLTDARTPTALSVVDASVSASAAIAETKLALATDAAAATGSRRTLGTTATSAAAGNDARLSDARTPTVHAGTHASGGTDAVALAASQVTSGALAPARLATGTPAAGKYPDGAGAWTTLPAGGGSSLGYKVGSYYAAQPAGIGTVGLNANDVKAQPYDDHPLSIDRIGIEVTTALAASTGRLYVWAMATDGTPGAVLLDAGQIDTSTTGFKEIVVATTALPSGRVFVGLWNGTAGYVVYRSNDPSFTTPQGMPVATTGVVLMNSWVKTNVTTNVSPFPTTAVTAAATPRILLRGA